MMKRKKGRTVLMSVSIVLALACVLALVGCKEAPVPISLSLDQGGMSKTTYNVGEVFNPDGLVATVAMSDGSTKRVPADVLSYTLGEKTLTRGTAFTTDDIGTNKVVGASYSGLRSTLAITVNAVTVSSVTVNRQPNTTAYSGADAALDLTGLRLRVVMSDGSTKYVDWTDDAGHNGITTDPADGTGISEDMSVTVTYGGNSDASFGVTFTEEARVLTGVSVRTPPGKLNYSAGEKFSAEGLALATTYETGADGTLAYGPASGMSFSGVAHNSALVPGVTEITQDDTVTVTYEGFSTVFDISYEAEKAVSAMEIKTPEAYEKTSVVDLETSEYEWPTDMVLTVSYNDGTTEEVVATSDMFSGKVDLRKVGPYTVTVTYEGIPDTYVVTVVEKPVAEVTLRSMSIVGADTRWHSRRYLAGTYAYPVGEMELSLAYSDGSKPKVSATDENFTGNDLEKLKTVGTHDVKVSYTFNDVTLEATIQIVVVALPVADQASGDTVPCGTPLKYTGVEPDMEIWYTTDGSDPAKGAGSLYDASEGIVIDMNQTVKARAYLTDTGVQSYPVETDAAMAEVTLNARLAKAVVAPGGTVPYGSRTYLKDVHEGAKAYYTVDGTTPTDGSTLYDATEGILVDKDLKVRTIVKMEGRVDSAVSEAVDVFAKLPAPVRAGTGDLQAGDRVLLTCSVDGVEIWYRTDGKDPTNGTADGSTKYTSEGIEVDENTMIRAKAYKEGCTASDAQPIDGLTVTLPAVTAALGDGSALTDGKTLDYGTKVYLSNEVPGVVFRYATDTTTVLAAGTGTAYDAGQGIEVDRNMTIRAKAFKEGYSASPELTVSDLKAKLPTPTITVYNKGTTATYTKGDADVKITGPSNEIEGAEIKYRTKLTGETGYGNWQDQTAGQLIQHYGSSKVMEIEAKLVKEGCEDGLVQTTVEPEWQVGDAGPDGGKVWKKTERGDYWEVKLGDRPSKVSTKDFGIPEGWEPMVAGWRTAEEVGTSLGSQLTNVFSLVRSYCMDDYLGQCLLSDRPSDQDSTRALFLKADSSVTTYSVGNGGYLIIKRPF